MCSTPRSDSAAAARFYSDVVGWTAEPFGGDMAYTVMKPGGVGHGVAGIMDLPEEVRGNGGRPGWVGYIHAQDVDAKTSEVAAAGGTIHRQPWSIPGVGRTKLDRYGEAYGIPLFDRAVDFGWFYFLTKPIFHILHFFYMWTGNYGVAILLLTLLVKLAFFPLANKSYKAMSHMKKLQPEMMRLRELYADDKVDLVVGTTSSAAALAMLPVAQEFKKPLIVEPAVADSITGEHWNRYIFRTARNSGSLRMRPGKNRSNTTWSASRCRNQSGLPQ